MKYKDKVLELRKYRVYFRQLAEIHFYVSAIDNVQNTSPIRFEYHVVGHSSVETQKFYLNLRFKRTFVYFNGF